MFKMDDIKISLRPIEYSDLEMIMNWRMDPEITRFMNTDPVLTMKGQKIWLENIRKNSDVRYDLIEIDGELSGVLNVSGLNNTEGILEWGYYIGNKEKRSFITAISLELSLYEYWFAKGIREIGGFVFRNNKGVIKLHKLCGCVEIPEKNKIVEKNGKEFESVYLSITREKWLSIKDKMRYIKVKF